jgi:hypothetical protein
MTLILEPATPAAERPQTYALERATAGFGRSLKPNVATDII